MNEVGVLAQSISDYSIPMDTGRFPTSFISGWLEANIGKLNALTHECFTITGTGIFGPTGLNTIEKSIFTELFLIYYYGRASRDSLRRSVYDENGSLASAEFNTLKEGDTYISRPDKNSISRTYSQMVSESKKNLDDLLFQYNNNKVGPLSVAGDDGNVNFYDFNKFNRAE